MASSIKSFYSVIVATMLILAPLTLNAAPILKMLDSGIEKAISPDKYVTMEDFNIDKDALSLSQTLFSFTGITITETETDFGFGLIGDAITADGSATFAYLGNFWDIIFTIDEDDGLINDALSINGTIQHVIAPHPGDAAFGPVQAFNLSVDADDEVGGIVTDNAAGNAAHPGIGHRDFFDANLTATVASVGFFDDITGYTFTLNAHHVPEPSFIYMLLLGITSLGISCKKIRRKV